MNPDDELRQRILSGRSDANIRASTTFDNSCFAWGLLSGHREVIISSGRKASANG